MDELWDGDDRMSFVLKDLEVPWDPGSSTYTFGSVASAWGKPKFKGERHRLD